MQGVRDGVAYKEGTVKGGGATFPVGAPAAATTESSYIAVLRDRSSFLAML